MLIEVLEIKNSPGANVEDAMLLEKTENVYFVLGNENNEKKKQQNRKEIEKCYMSAINVQA